MQSFFSALPYLRTLRQLGSIACAALLLAACSSGGGDGGGGTPPVAAPLAGVVIDSPIAGLGYNAAPSGLSGITSATGQFNYNPGDNLTFNIGGRTVGNPVPGAPVITGLMLFGATSLTDTSVVNLAQLLLTLGGIPAGQNPIPLPATLPANFPLTLNFSDVNFDTSFPGLTLVSEAAATTHLQAQFSTVSVTLAGAGSGTVASNPTGINCGTTCSNVFINGNSVTLTATGSGFAGWSAGTGNAASCTGTGPCTFTPTSDSNITATFNIPPPPTLTISTAGTGSGTVACSTGGPFTTCAASYTAGTQVTTQATANIGSIFTVWTNGTGNAISCNNTSGSCVMTLNANSTVTANFNLPVMNFVTSNTASANGGGGTVQCSADGGTAGPCGSYLGGTQIVMTATPNSASNFTGWSATVCSGTGTCNFILTANTTVTANFNRPTLTVSRVGTGTVTSDVGGINCGAMCSAVLNRGTVVTLTASGTGFSGWSGGGCAGIGTCQVTLNADTTVIATFGAVSALPNFKFIAAAGNQLLAINPQVSPATPTAVQVNGVPVTFPNVGGAGAAGARLIRSATSYDAGTTSFLGIKEDTIIFTSGGRIFKASTLVSSGVPGVAQTNVPQRVSSLATAKPCGMGSTGDLTNTTNRVIGFLDAGADSLCPTGDDFIVLMHLNDGEGTAPLSLPVGTTIDGNNFSALNLTTGAFSRAFLSTAAGNLQWIDTTLAAPTSITGGDAVGSVADVVTGFGWFKYQCIASRSRMDHQADSPHECCTKPRKYGTLHECRLSKTVHNPGKDHN